MSMKRYLLALLAAASALFWSSTPIAATGSLENPQPGGIETGIGAITGWHCTSKNIEVRVDGGSVGRAGTGTPRLDTATTCDGRTDTGFSFLLNYALMHGGTHKVDVYADGILFGSATFQVGYLGAEFLTGLSSAHRIPDFPSRGQGTRLVWQQSKQNFVIAGVEPLTGGSLIGTYSIRNVWARDSTGLTFSTLAPGASASGTWTFRADGTMTTTFTLVVNGQSQTASASGTYTDYGYYIDEGGPVDLVIERGDTLTISNLGPTATGSWGSIVVSISRNQTSAMAEIGAAGPDADGLRAGGAFGAIGTALKALSH
jgi:hypothetical protein